MIQVSDLSFSVIAPKMKTKFLVYDVETTGLLPRGNKHSMPIEEYPHIIQLSFAIYDYETKRIVWEYDSYVKLDNVDIPEKITNITGITKEICETQGNPMHEVLEKFYEAYMFCEGLVAHNMDFDEKMIKIELERNRPILMKTAPHCFICLLYTSPSPRDDR
mgnify:FL=1